MCASQKEETLPVYKHTTTFGGQRRGGSDARQNRAVSAAHQRGLVVKATANTRESKATQHVATALPMENWWIKKVATAYLYSRKLEDIPPLMQLPNTMPAAKRPKLAAL